MPRKVKFTIAGTEATLGNRVCYYGHVSIYRFYIEYMQLINTMALKYTV